MTCTRGRRARADRHLSNHVMPHHVTITRAGPKRTGGAGVSVQRSVSQQHGRNEDARARRDGAGLQAAAAAAARAPPELHPELASHAQLEIVKRNSTIGMIVRNFLFSVYWVPPSSCSQKVSRSYFSS